jgi:hypothetical protein
MIEHCIQSHNTFREGISDVGGNFCGWFINKYVWWCSTLETSRGRVCSFSPGILCALA